MQYLLTISTLLLLLTLTLAAPTFTLPTPTPHCPSLPVATAVSKRGKPPPWQSYHRHSHPTSWATASATLQPQPQPQQDITVDPASLPTSPPDVAIEISCNRRYHPVSDSEYLDEAPRPAGDWQCKLAAMNKDEDDTDTDSDDETAFGSPPDLGSVYVALSPTPTDLDPLPEVLINPRNELVKTYTIPFSSGHGYTQSPTASPTSSASAPPWATHAPHHPKQKPLSEIEVSCTRQVVYSKSTEDALVARGADGEMGVWRCDGRWVEAEAEGMGSPPVVAEREEMGRVLFPPPPTQRTEMEMEDVGEKDGEEEVEKTVVARWMNKIICWENLFIHGSKCH